MKTVSFNACACGHKRGFRTERDAEKALGRAQAKRSRSMDRRGTRKGLRVEGRMYECEQGMWHLTAMSRRDYTDRVADLFGELEVAW